MARRGERKRRSEQARKGWREGVATGKPVVTNKAYRRDKSIVPRLYATNPRYNVLPLPPLILTATLLGASGAREKVRRVYPTTLARATLLHRSSRRYLLLYRSYTG